MSPHPSENRRILVVDDNEDIHDDFRRILAPRGDTSDLDELEAALLGGTSTATPRPPTFELTSAHQGSEALAKVQKALADGSPYALAFIDVRMPPGWDGVETLARIWQEDPRLQAVICSAYSDYSWEAMSARFGRTDRLLVLKKPFDPLEVRQMACALVDKWNHLARPSAPTSLALLPLSEDVVLLPLLGQVDPERLRQVREALVMGLSSRRARFAILDVTGVPGLGSELAEGLIGAARAVSLAGAELVLTGVGPEFVRALALLGGDLGGVKTHSTLQSGVAFALEKPR
ncbi:Putative diguanylate cyclase/phosphodiesterase [Cystobacter fuscus]|uniref:Diguanylate cyclase/phosphodiesterase n=1 Tax=Cystobacter fuscus TaxID=43 RepID=A0A250IZ81_9BACT|nr:response regulator [Cystobacter fuscus]ATB36568.1 Putative diguanylate cyclase/phosphodiesterase [Cystobacter fuscus]